MQDVAEALKRLPQEARSLFRVDAAVFSQLLLITGAGPAQPAVEARDGPVDEARLPFQGDAGQADAVRALLVAHAAGG